MRPPAGIPLAIFLALYGFHAFAAQNLVDQDLWGHLAFGRASWMLGDVVRLDPYSYLPTRPWINHEWLAEVIMYLVLSAGGGVGLLIFKGLAGAGTGVLAGRARPAPAVLVVAIAAVALHGMEANVHVRPYVFTYFFFAGTMALLERFRERRRLSGWLLPVLIGVWASCHAAFVMGLGVMLLYLLAHVYDRERERAVELAAILTVSLVTTLVNPYGGEYWPFVLEAVGMQRPYITEWQPVPWHGAWFWEFKVLLVAAIVAVGASLARRHLTGKDVVAYLLLAITAWMALSHYRHVPLFLIAAMAYLPAMLAALRPVPDRPLVPVIAATIALALVALQLPRTANGLVIPLAGSPGSYMFPARSAEFIRLNGLRGDTLCFFDWGEFLIWELWPRVRVAFDGRLETVYSREVIEQNLALTRGQPEGLALVREYPATLALLAPRATNLLKASGGWLPVYTEGEATLLVHDTPENRARKWKTPDWPEADGITLDEWLAAHPVDSHPLPARSR